MSNVLTDEVLTDIYNKIVDYISEKSASYSEMINVDDNGYFRKNMTPKAILDESGEYYIETSAEGKRVFESVMETCHFTKNLWIPKAVMKNLGVKAKSGQKAMVALNELWIWKKDKKTKEKNHYQFKQIKESKRKNQIYLFNAEQCDGIEGLYKKERKSPIRCNDNRDKGLDRMFKNFGKYFDVYEGCNNPKTLFDEKGVKKTEIYFPEFNQCKSSFQYYQIALHEFGHALRHHVFDCYHGMKRRPYHEDYDKGSYKFHNFYCKEEIIVDIASILFEYSVYGYVCDDPTRYDEYFQYAGNWFERYFYGRAKQARKKSLTPSEADRFAKEKFLLEIAPEITSLIKVFEEFYKNGRIDFKVA